MSDELMLQELMEKERARRIKTRGEVGRVICTGGVPCNLLNQGGCIVISSL